MLDGVYLVIENLQEKRYDAHLAKLNILKLKKIETGRPAASLGKPACAVGHQKIRRSKMPKQIENTPWEKRAALILAAVFIVGFIIGRLWEWVG